MNEIMHEQLAPCHHVNGRALVAVFLSVKQLLELVQLLVILVLNAFCKRFNTFHFITLTSQPGGARHEIGWQLAQGRPSTPAHCGEADLGHNRPNCHVTRIIMLPLGTVDLVWVGRLGEVGGAALVRRQGDAGDEWAQEQEERMQPGAQADTAQDAQLVN